MTNPTLRSALAGAVLCALACGGGSGSSQIAVALDAQAVQLTGPEGTSQRQRVIVTTTGAAGPVHAQATADGSGIDRVDVSYLGADTLLDVRSSAALAAGVYRGTLTVVVCSDEACQRPVGGTPVHVPYMVTVTRALRVTPGPVRLAAVSGAGADAAVAVTLPEGASRFDVDVTTGAGWLTVSDRTAVGFLVHAGVRPPGSYVGALRVTAGEVATVVEVQYAVAARPLAVTPGAVALAAVSGAGAEAAVAVTLPDGALDFAVDPGADGWLSVVDRTARGCTLRARSLPAGTYRTAAVFTAGGLEISLPVSCVVTAPPGGEHGTLVAPASLSFSATEGAPSAVKALAVTPPTWRPALQARVEYQDALGWLRVSPTEGGYDVQADAGALSQGSYAATLVLSGDASTTELRVPVALTVGAGLVRPPDRELAVGVATTAADLSGSAAIEVLGGPPRGWTAASDASWLVLDRAAGQTGEALRYHVAVAHVAAMADGASEVATLTVRAAPATLTPVQFRVTLSRSLARVTGVRPGAQPAGRPTRVLVRGAGLGAPGVAARLVVGGLTPVAVERWGDSELEVSLPAAPAGAYAVQVANALDLPTGAATLQLFAPGPLPPARLPQPGGKAGLVYDPVRRAIFVADATAGLLLRYQLVDGAWVAAQRSIAGLTDLGGDGALLVALSSTGTLRLVDPVSLADVAAYDDPRFGIPYGAFGHSLGVPVTNDGKAWLPGGGGAWTLAYFDLSTRELGTGRLDPGLLVYEGPWYSMSRDGERLVVCLTDGTSPQSPLLYLDASDAVVRTSPASWKRFESAAQSDDGRRLLLDSAIVFDEAQAVVGMTSVPAGFTATEEIGGYQRIAGLGGALSPDGRRAYVLAYPADPAVAPPRVFAFDTSQVPFSGIDLPIVGSFDLPDYPGCRRTSASCSTRTSPTAITPDGRTLIFAGTEAVMVVPIPDALISPGVAP